MLNEKLASQLNSANKITDLLDVKHVQVQVGALGGRTFKLSVGENSYSFKMNDLIKYVLNKLQKDSALNQDELDAIVKQLSEINEKGDKKVKGCLKKFGTKLIQGIQKTRQHREKMFTALKHLPTQQPPKSGKASRKQTTAPGVTGQKLPTEPQDLGKKPVNPPETKPVSTVKAKPVKLVMSAELEQAWSVFKNSPFYKYLGGTSDHSWKTYSCKFESGTPFEVKVGTWNLSDVCYHSKKGGFYNNPLNHVEKPEDYIARKRVQLEEIRNLITGGSFGEGTVEGVSAFAFQEVDFYFAGIAALQKSRRNEKLFPQEQAFLTVYTEFYQILEKCGWEFIGTDLQAAKAAQDQLLVIYDPKQITPKATTLSSSFLQTGQNRGGSCEFTHNDSKREFVLTNLHLKYDVPPQDQIEEYQQEQLGKKMPTIALGDLNRTPNKKLDSSIADWGYPTNIDAETVADRGKPEKLSIKDSDNPKLNKAYDAAIVNPGGEDERAVITETEMAYFEKKESEVGFKQVYKNINIPHKGLPGRPWMKNRELLKKLEEARKVTADGSAEAARLDKDMEELRKNLDKKAPVSHR